MQMGRSVSRGTGCLVADGLVLTALHVVADWSKQSLTPHPGEISLTFANGSVKASILEEYCDRLADWALLRCESLPPNTSHSRNSIGGAGAEEPPLQTPQG